jgi:hypothetical protein
MPATSTPKRSKAQKAASRANGAKSRGPKTAQGKQRSARNNLKHGLRSKSIESTVTLGDREHYNELRQSYLDEYRPSGPTECTLVDYIIYAAWQIYRIRELELNASLDFGLLGSIGNSEKYARYRASFERAFYKAVTELRKIQNERVLRDTTVDRRIPAHLPPGVSSEACLERMRQHEYRAWYPSGRVNPSSFAPAPVETAPALPFEPGAAPAPLQPKGIEPLTRRTAPRPR